MTQTAPAAHLPESDRLTSLIDKAHLSTMTGGDVDLALEIIEIFRNQTEIWAKMLDAGQSPGLWADAAHSLKGAALSLGANKLAASCAAAETLGRREAPPSKAEAAVALSEIKDDLGQTLEAAAHLSHQIERTRSL